MRLRPGTRRPKPSTRRQRKRSGRRRTARVKQPFFTVGHSNRSLEEFVELLRSAEIGLLADVRRIPRSRSNPQFNQDVLGGSLTPFGISYEPMAALGGRRGVVESVSPDVNGLWRNLSFHNYADYA